MRLLQTFGAKSLVRAACPKLRSASRYFQPSNCAAVRCARLHSTISWQPSPLKALQLRGRFYSTGGQITREQVEGRIMSLLKGFDKVKDVNQIAPTSHFHRDLGLDSLDVVEVVMAIEEEFSLEMADKDADQIHSIPDAVEYVMAQPDAL